MKVCTFNIRCDYGQDDENTFQNRAPHILKKINDAKPDIIGFQEVVPKQFDWLCENLTDYAVVGCGRDADLGGEHMVIAVKSDSIQLLSLNTFWLSPTPQDAGTRFPKQSSCPRTCTTALVRVHGITETIAVMVTHLDHEESYARKAGLELILSRMDRTRPVILMGDFNAEPGAPELEPIVTDRFLHNVSATVGATFHDYGRQELQLIDYVYTTKNFTAKSAQAWTDCVDGIYLSDHYPVEVELM